MREIKRKGGRGREGEAEEGFGRGHVLSRTKRLHVLKAYLPVLPARASCHTVAQWRLLVADLFDCKGLRSQDSSKCQALIVFPIALYGELQRILQGIFEWVDRYSAFPHGRNHILFVETCLHHWRLLNYRSDNNLEVCQTVGSLRMLQSASSRKILW